MIRNMNSRNRIKSEDKLVSQIQELIKETNSGKLKWDLIYSTTEYNYPDKKPVEEIDGKPYVVDETYVSYHTMIHDKEFLMITYEMIHQCNNDVRSNNLIFMPPLGIRYFDLTNLLPYAVEANQILTYHIHQLWQIILERKKASDPMIDLEVEPRELVIED